MNEIARRFECKRVMVSFEERQERILKDHQVPEFYALFTPEFERNQRIRLRALLNDEMDVERAFENAREKIVTNWNQFKGRSQRSTWAVRIMINEGLKFYLMPSTH